MSPGRGRFIRSGQIMPQMMRDDLPQPVQTRQMGRERNRRAFGDVAADLPRLPLEKISQKFFRLDANRTRFAV